MEKQNKTSADDILELLREIQQLSHHIAKCPLNITDPKQLDRDLCNLKANVFMLEIKIEHTETLLTGFKQSGKVQSSNSLKTLRKAVKEHSVTLENELHTPKLG